MQVPIKILRDTETLDYFILDSVLPFSSKTDTDGYGPILCPVVSTGSQLWSCSGGGVGGCLSPVAC